MDRNPTEAIIFDLGRVVIHLDETKTSNEFLKISSFDESDLQNALQAEPYFNQFERGEIEAEEFRRNVSRTLGFAGDGSEIDIAWNAMLGGIDKPLIDSIIGLGEKLKIFVLSNTNIIHEIAFNKILKDSTGHNNLHEIFHKVYFSHEIGARKPELNSWEMILQEQSLDPQRVLFLDDRLDNIEAAASLRMNVLQITDPYHTYEVIKPYLS
ncbi:MAG: HAD family phosphatase [bacterium]|nr:HAD family phosphatase [bacterium]